MWIVILSEPATAGESKDPYPACVHVTDRALSTTNAPLAGHRIANRHILVPRYTGNMSRPFLLCGAVLLALVGATAQSQPPAALPNQAEIADLVAKQFGAEFKPAPFLPRGVGGQLQRNAAPILLLTGDLDGDGTEDAVIVAKAGANLLAGQQQYGYKVVDPFDSYFGFGDPRVTRQFGSADPGRDYALLVIHNWRAATPKAKFVIINLPFDRLWLQPSTLKKKSRTAIMTEEAGLMQSTVYWDGKRYRYVPGTGEAEP